jgi:hypothetical protein
MSEDQSTDERQARIDAAAERLQRWKEKSGEKAPKRAAAYGRLRSELLGEPIDPADEKTDSE